MLAWRWEFEYVYCLGSTLVAWEGSSGAREEGGYHQKCCQGLDHRLRAPVSRNSCCDTVLSSMVAHWVERCGMWRLLPPNVFLRHQTPVDVRWIRKKQRARHTWHVACDNSHQAPAKTIKQSLVAKGQGRGHCGLTAYQHWTFQGDKPQRLHMQPLEMMSRHFLVWSREPEPFDARS